MNARSVPCPYCGAGKGQECRSMELMKPRKKVLDHTARKQLLASRPRPAQWSSSPTPWTVEKSTRSRGEAVKIVDAQGFTIAVMQGAAREANANAIVRIINKLREETAE